MSDTQEVFFVLNNLPASSQHPFSIEISGKQVFQSTVPIKTRKLVTTQVPIPKFSSITTAYVTFKVPARDVDDLKKLNITHHGEYVSVEYDEKQGLVIKQRPDEHFGYRIVQIL